MYAYYDKSGGTRTQYLGDGQSIGLYAINQGWDGDSDSTSTSSWDDGCPLDDPEPTCRLKRTKQRAPFLCDGTLLRHTNLKRKKATISKPHAVPADPAHPAVCIQQVSSGRSSRIDWTKCTECVELDDAFMKRGNKVDQSIDEALWRHEAEQASEAAAAFNASRKRMRDEHKDVARRVLQAPLPSPATHADSAALAVWMRALGKSCTLPELKSLCRANYSMVGGTKPELLLRLAHVKHHGGPGRCPSCRNARLAFEYDDSADGEADLAARPSGVVCKFMYLSSRRMCSYRARYSSKRAQPLVDTDDGILEQAGLL